jgi:hypothetical protein
MALWEYKVISSGRGGFATPALLEKFLNDLGKEEWEIIDFRAQPDNPLAFSGLARRTTQRDWTLEDAAAAAARNEAEKLRAEFEAKFKGIGGGSQSAAESAAAAEEAEKPSVTDDFRRVRDTSSDQDPDADDEPKDEWDQLTEENELPTFFDAIRPHLRRNQRGPGMSAGLEHLCKRWNLTEEDLKGALVECGFEIPQDEDDKPVYIEYEGDLYWLNLNRRGEIWINTKDKPRPVFRAVPGTRVTPDPTEQAAPESDRKSESNEGREGRGRNRGGEADGASEAAASATPGEPLPEGPALLEKIRPLMRRNRRGPGGSGSGSFLSRALKCKEADLAAAFAALGLVEAATPNDKPVEVEINGDIWWVNRDSRGGLWINGRRKDEGGEVPTVQGGSSEGGSPAPAEASAPTESAPAATEAAPAAIFSPTPAAAGESGGILSAVRPHLKEAKAGTFASDVCDLAPAVGKGPEEFVAALVAAGLKKPEKPRERPVYVDHDGDAFWLTRTAEDALLLNAKVSKAASGTKRGKSKKQDE